VERVDDVHLAKARSATQTVLPSGEKKPSCEARPTLVWDTTVLSTVRSTVTVLVVAETTSR